MYKVKRDIFQRKEEGGDAKQILTYFFFFLTLPKRFMYKF